MASTPLIAPAFAHEPSYVQLCIPAKLRFSDDELFDLCAVNEVLQIERSAEGHLEILPLVGFESSVRNARISCALFEWAEEDGEGIAASSSAGYLLPNGAMRAPSAAWVRRSRLEGVSPEQRQKFLPLAPDFVIELRSPSDSLPALRRKMEEGWTIGTVDGHPALFRIDEPPKL